MKVSVTPLHLRLTDGRYQLIIEQVERDARVEELMSVVAGVYSYLLETNFSKTPAFEKTLQRLVRLTGDCAHFIVAYQDKLFGKCDLEAGPGYPDIFQ